MDSPQYLCLIVLFWGLFVCVTKTVLPGAAFNREVKTICKVMIASLIIINCCVYSYDLINCAYYKHTAVL